MFFIMFVLALCSVNSKGEILHSTLKASSVGCQSVMDDLEIWINGATQAATVTRIISKNFTTQTLTVNGDINFPALMATNKFEERNSGKCGDDGDGKITTLAACREAAIAAGWGEPDSRSQADVPPGCALLPCQGCRPFFNNRTNTNVACGSLHVGQQQYFKCACASEGWSPTTSLIVTIKNLQTRIERLERNVTNNHRI